VETLCVKPAEFSGFRTQIGQSGKNTIYPGVNKKKGIEKGDFVKFDMPFLRTTASTFRPVSVSVDDVKKVWVFADRISEDDLEGLLDRCPCVHFFGAQPRLYNLALSSTSMQISCAYSCV